MYRTVWIGLAGVSSLFVACSESSTTAVSTHAFEIDRDWLERYARTGRFRHGEVRSPVFTPDGGSVLFLQSGPRDPHQSLHRIDLATGTVSTVVTADALLGDEESDLSDAELARRERQRIKASGIVSLELTPEGDAVLVPLNGRVFRVALADGSSDELSLSGEGALLDPRLSPNGRHLAYVRDDGFYVYDFDGRRSRRLVSAGEDGVSVGLAEFVAQEEMDRDHGYWWSPDSKTLVYQRTDERTVATLHRASLSKPDAESVAQRYPRPGAENASVELFLISVWGGASTAVKWDRDAYPYVTRVTWSDNAPLTVVVQNREQKSVVVLSVDERGNTLELHREADPAWVAVDSAVPAWLPNGSGFLWSSERDGDWQLELRERTGELTRVLVPMNLGYRKLVGLSPEGKSVVVNVGRDPTSQKVARVQLADGSVTLLREREGFHEALAVGPGGSSVVRSETLSTRPMVRVLAQSGERILPSKAEGPGEIRTRILQLEGERRYYAAVTVPPGLAPGTKRPGLFYIYGGPTSVTVERRSSRVLLDQWFARAGFVVFRIDARGTPRRGSAWNRAIKDDLFSAPLADYVEAVGLLSAAVPELDVERIGVYGWSFGGYATAMALMRAPETFHAGMAGAPVVDWADYDTHYTERYLGVPQDVGTDPAYRVSNVLTYADDLARPLMLVHGTSDDNVFFLHTIKLSDRLTRNAILHRVVPLANETHGVKDPERLAGLYLSAVRFFQEALAEPERLPSKEQRETSAALTGLKTD